MRQQRASFELELELAPGEGRPRRDPEAALQRARDVAWRALNRRDRTVTELRELLAGKACGPDSSEQVIAELLEGGYLDDARFAQRFAEDRRRLDSWGSERIERRLRALGVHEDHVAAAVGVQDSEEELEGAVALLRRRVPLPLESPRNRERALGMLVRRGYALDVAYAALRRRARGEQ